MGYVLLLCRFALLALSSYGYIRLIGKHIRMEFAPGIFFTAVCSLMFLAGILNVLQEAAWAVCAGGVWLAVISFRRRESLRPVLCPGLGFFVLSAVVLLIALHGMILTDYDDFSHWGTVLKVMYTENRFPKYGDSVITYQSYPPGSAGFLYYFLTIAGITSEWFQLYVQAIFMVGVLASLFAFASDGLGWIFAAFAAAAFLLCSNGPINLLVDTLLPVVAVGALCFCYYYRKELQSKIYWIVPYLISLTAIKNSGILFAVFLLVYVLCRLGKEGLRSWLWVCAAPVLTLLFWQKHVLLVFDNGLNSRHAMSVESVADNFLRKGREDVRAVIRVFLEQVLSLENPAVYLIVLILVLLVFRRFLGLQWTKDSRWLVLFAGASYVVYEIGVLGMYITTMPYAEAIVLAGYERYHRTILIFCGGCLFLAVTHCGQKTEKQRIWGCLISAFLLYQALFPGLWYNNPKHCGFIREDFEQLITENAVQAERSYCVVLDENYASKYTGYLQYLIRYLLDSVEIKVCSIDVYEASEAGWEGYDYLICFGESEEMDAFLWEITGSAEQRVLTQDSA